MEVPCHEGGRQRPRATTGKCGIEGVNVGAANERDRRLLSCLEPGQFSQTVLQDLEALCEGATQGIFALLLLLLCLEGTWAAVQRD